MGQKQVVGIVALGEAGNLGDDLILAASVSAVQAAMPDAEIHYLSFGQQIDWQPLKQVLGLRRDPVRVAAPRFVPWSRAHKLFADADVMVVGGGGLFQTSHHPLKPFHWLDHLPLHRGVPVIGIGLGLGPLSTHWRENFARRDSPFDALYVRDDDSLRFAQSELGWPAGRCLDFVDDAFLRAALNVHPGVRASSRTLGVSLREWPGLAAEEVASHIQKVAADTGCTAVRFFVLEAKGMHGADVDFSRRVADLVSPLQSFVHPYDPAALSEFCSMMTDCDVAIGMKLHACAIWSAAGVPVLPIIYAPKIAAFFGMEYSGTEIVREVRAPGSSWSEGFPRSHDVLAEVLPTIVAGSGAGDRFGALERQYYRWRALGISLRARLRRLLDGNRPGLVRQ